MTHYSPIELARLRQSLNQKLRTEANRRGASADMVRKQFVFAIFLGRLFSKPESDPQWVLLGGNALLIRTGGGRFTQDIDLARQTSWDDLEEIRTDLEHRLGNTGTNPFRFTITDIETAREPDAFGYGAATVSAKVAASLDTEFDRFKLDITTRRHLDAPVDSVPLVPIIDHELLAGLPAVPTVPVENHLADKICALYEPHGAQQAPSTRWRDLADIVRIIQTQTINADRIQQVLGRETGRRHLELPPEIKSPGPLWEERFPAAARDFTDYPPSLHPLEASLQAAATCINPILAGQAAGVWDPDHQAWQH